MDDDVIDDIAQAFLNQLMGIEACVHSPHLNSYRNQCWDDIIAMACVINLHVPTYDLRYFYNKCGYPEPYPVHDVQF